MLNWERGADQTGREGRVPSERSLAGPALRERILELVEALRPAAQAYLDPLGISFFSLMFWIFRNKEGEGWMGA